jgi:rhombotail lipoprotein
MRPRPVWIPLVLGVALALGCAAAPAQRRASVVDYLYPQGAPAQPPSDVALELPVVVGLAFAPGPGAAGGENVFDERLKRELLEKIAAAFRNLPEIERVEILTGTDLTAGGGFANLDQVAAMHALDLALLISYEQVQFEDLKRSSWTYWTIVGAYVIEGQQNETSTVLDASLFDIRSRTLLLRASGTSKLTRSATSVDASRAMRRASSAGFASATDDLIAELAVGLEAFREQAKSGRVRGAGTPAITVTSSGAAAEGGTGAGAVGAVESLGALLLAVGAATARRKRA